MPFDTPLRVELRPSRLLAGFVALTTLAAMLAVMRSGLSWPWRGLLTVAAMAIGWREWLRVRRPWRGAILTHDGAGGWRLMAPGFSCEGPLVGRPVRLPGILRLTVTDAAGRSHRWLLARDMMDANAFRRLVVRAWLDTRPAGGSAGRDGEGDAHGDRTQVSGSR